MSSRKVFPSCNISKFFKEVRAHDAVDGEIRGDDLLDNNDWSTMLPELLSDIIRRVVDAEEQWPHRQNIVACACVCKRWRDMTREIIDSTSEKGKITFPSCLKQPGPHELPQQCLVKKNKNKSMFYLYLALTESFTDKGKFLLAARRYRFGYYNEYVFSLDADHLSQASNAYVGKLSSNFQGNNFTIYDKHTPHSGVKASRSKARASCCCSVASKQIYPQDPTGNFEVGHVTYMKKQWAEEGPRRMVCSLKSPTVSSLDGHKMQCKEHVASSGYTMYKNKDPRPLRDGEGWCLNFHGRVKIMASVKNFQLVAIVDQSQPGDKEDEETILLQFGKVGDDTYSLEYRDPLSAFQAFAICLTTFGPKLACE